MLAAVGFEPTPPKRLEPKSSALDHSATLPCRGPFSASPHPKDRENGGHGSPSQRPSEFFAQAQETFQKPALAAVGFEPTPPKRLKP
ncbi:hypothetical protein ROHU_005266 [Labeo rohita]|uniref:Uncharacterized protein n=1 Tax=Labeo rohita TaxID=84645 RepID=A0A498NCT3_LABRO|nr:hypothetical protein ROHU_005266 [Labeo rohita]